MVYDFACVSAYTMQHDVIQLVSFIYIYSTEHQVITEILFYMALTTHNHTLMKIVTDKSIIYECIASYHWVLMTMHKVQSIKVYVLGLPLWYLQTILL